MESELELGHNLFSILEVTPQDDDLTVKAAYRRLLLQSHPDKVGGSKQAVHQVTTAYEILKTGPGRKAYLCRLQAKEQKQKQHNPFMEQQVSREEDMQEVQCGQCGDYTPLSEEVLQMLEQEQGVLLECLSCNQQIDLQV